MPPAALDRFAAALAGSADALGYWVRPQAPFAGAAAAEAVASGTALPLAGGPRAFSLVELIRRDAAAESGMSGVVLPLAEARAWAAGNGTAAQLGAQLGRLSAARPDWAGLRLDRPLLMGIINVTPDSFSDGGEFAGEAAVEHGRRLLDAGADLLDIGGESTRPGAAPVGPEEERRRVESVIRRLAEAGAVVSIDTRHAATMECALAAGARIINDVTALTGDPASLGVAARSGAPVILMHMQGDPQTMQRDPVYAAAPLDVLEYLEARIAACAAVGIDASRIVVDPGIGFGKRLRHNLQILARLSLLHLTGSAILLGASRKSFISSAVARGETPKERLPGSLAAALGALGQGVQLLRVHDVAETWQAIQVWRGVADAG
jgi:dihydropteroate synthase